jgi:ceramide glucosyltransferase
LYAYFASIAAWASVAFYAVATLGCGYALCAAWAARSFIRAAPPPAGACPAITILKPLHGLEPNLYAHLASFCAQNYPSPVQIVFGVDDPADPAIGIVKRLIADFSGGDLILAVESRRHGENRKVSNLINMARRARHEVLVVSDSDIVVEPDYLRHIAAALARPGVGLVTCLYRGTAAASVWARLSAAAIDYQFLPNVLVGLKLGLAAPCFGSTIALRSVTLAEIGGFEAVADQLADDYALGALVRRHGLSVAIPGNIVTHVCDEQSARDLIRHEIRWARTIRSIDPLGFAGLAITHALPLALLGLILGGVNAAGFIAVAALACRFVLQSEIDRAFNLPREFYWLGPLRDMLSFAIFVASFLGRGVEWRGHHYGPRADGRFVRYGEVET